MKTVIIFGGSGYVGQHLIRRIAKNGHKIIIPYQSPTNEANLRLLGSIGQIYPLKYRSIEDSFIINQINIADVIINLKTQWDERKTKFEVGILGFNKKITNHLKINNPNCHFVFFTGLGIDKNSKSQRSNSIFEAEIVHALADGEISEDEAAKIEALRKRYDLSDEHAEAIIEIMTDRMKK